MSAPLGLTAAEAASRLAASGPNVLAPVRFTSLRLLGRQFKSPLLLLLLLAAIVSFFFGDRPDAVIIGIIVCFSVGLSFANEFSADRSARALAERLAHQATVFRDGVPQLLPAAQLVVGDVVQLTVGDIVPADARLLTAEGVEVDEANLTGESLPVSRTSGGEVFASTTVTAGHGTAQVLATGRSTKVGRIAGGLALSPPPTGFQIGLAQFSMLLVRVAALLTIGIFTINLLLQRPWLDAVLFSLAIAVGISPQLLPAVVSTSLAYGARRLARQQVLVKRQVAIEDLGDIEVLCTDKTGTLTEGTLTFEKMFGDIPDSELMELVNNCTDLTRLADGRLVGNALDLAWAQTHPATQAWPRLTELAFEHHTRTMSALVLAPDGRRLLIVKGAPEAVIARSGADGTELAGRIDAELAAGKRTVAVATAECAEGVDLSNVPLQLVGALVFSDPLKPSAAQSLARLDRLGVRVVIVTGDSPVVANLVCDELGMAAGRTLSGSEIDQWNDARLQLELADVRICARVSPEQKARIVRLLRAAGSEVAFMGDGVNDALALRAADVGISVADACDVARDAADVVLLSKELDVLAAGVLEGRRIFANTMKYVLMGTSSNFGNMFSAAAASAFLPFLPMLPSQILLNNLLYDTSQLAIPTDRVDDELVSRPSEWDVAMIRRFMLIFGPISSLFDFIMFAVLLRVFQSDASAFRAGWFVESLATQTLVIFVIRTWRPALRSRPGGLLTASALCVVLVGAVVPLLPLNLGFSPVPPMFYAVVTGLTLVYLVIVDRAKGFARATLRR